MPAPTHTCPTCKRPLEARDQQILDLVQTDASYEEIGHKVGVSVVTIQRVARRYGMSRPHGRPWPKTEK